MSASRMRSRGGFAAAPQVVGQYIDSSCVHLTWTQNDANSNFLRGEYEEMSDIVTDRFSSRRAKGEIIMNPMSKTRTSSLSYGGQGAQYRRTGPPPANCVATGAYTRYQQVGDWFPYYVLRAYGITSPAKLPVTKLLTDSEVARLTDDVSIRCKASRTVADSNLFESVAEYRSTMRTMRDLTTNLLPTLRSYAKSPLVGAASVELMIRNAIMPFVRDVQGIVKGIGKPRGRVRKTTRTFGELSKSSSSNATFSYGVLTQTISIQTTDEVKVRCMSLDEYQASLLNNIGFTDGGLLLVPWELIRLSYVIDWFINVNHFIGSLIPISGREHLGSCYVIHRKCSSYFTPVSTVAAANYACDAQVTGSCISTLETVTRSPGFRDTRLLIKPDFRFGEFLRVADALAIAIKIITGISDKERDRENRERQRQSRKDRALNRLKSNLGRKPFLG